MIALVVCFRVLRAVDERLERHALQSNGSDQQEGQSPSPTRTPVCASRMVHSGHVLTEWWALHHVGAR